MCSRAENHRSISRRTFLGTGASVAAMAAGSRIMPALTPAGETLSVTRSTSSATAKCSWPANSMSEDAAVRADGIPTVFNLREGELNSELAYDYAVADAYFFPLEPHCNSTR